MMAASAAQSQTAESQTTTGRFRKGICSVIFPKGMPVTDYFARAKSAGFEGIEIPLGDAIPVDAAAGDLARIADAAAKEKVEIVSLWISAPLNAAPLNHPDASVRARGIEIVKRCIDIAAQLNCGAVLLVPGRLGNGAKFQYGYQDTWERVTASVKELIPHAAGRKVTITPENVWNKFLVSPLEMRAFIDQFHSPWVQAHFDIGNVMQFGFPQDWILTLGSRIKRLHVKDYKLSVRAEQGRFTDLLQGDVDWRETMAALVKVGYRGFASPEIGHDPANPDQLRSVSDQLDKILAMA
jgi:L-ribulose-5-phosphate 3-epimerase